MPGLLTKRDCIKRRNMERIKPKESLASTTGIVLMVGLNLVGKSTALEMMAEEDLFGGKSLCLSASRLYKLKCKAMIGKEIGEITPEERAVVGEELLGEIAQISKDRLVVLDAHLCREDGSIVEYSPLAGDLQAVLLITSSISELHRRAVASKDKGIKHPGREAMLNMDRVRKLDRTETNLAYNLANDLRVPLLRIDNAGTFNDLRNQITDLW